MHTKLFFLLWFLAFVLTACSSGPSEDVVTEILQEEYTRFEVEYVEILDETPCAISKNQEVNGVSERWLLRVRITNDSESREDEGTLHLRKQDGEWKTEEGLFLSCD